MSEPLPALPDRFGIVFPDGEVLDVTEGARLFGHDGEQRARRIAAKYDGTAVRIVTTLVALP